MPHLLHLDSSVDAKHSRSRAITATFATAWREHGPDCTITYRDLARDPLAGRPAVIVNSQGASYDAHTPTEGWDHAVPVLELILGTALGMTLTVITTSLTLAETVPVLADQIDRSRAELARAHERAAETANRLAAAS